MINVMGTCIANEWEEGEKLKRVSKLQQLLLTDLSTQSN